MQVSEVVSSCKFEIQQYYNSQSIHYIHQYFTEVGTLQTGTMGSRK